MDDSKDLSSPTSWKHYLAITGKFLALFYLSTFSVALFILHRGKHWIIPAIIIGALYLFITIAMLYRLIKKLPMAAIMLAAPTIPLIMLIIIASMIPLLQLVG